MTVTGLGSRVFTDDQVKPRPVEWILMVNLCWGPYKRGKCVPRERHMQREGSVETGRTRIQAEGCCGHEEWGEAGRFSLTAVRRDRHCPHLEARLPALEL